MFHAIRAHFAAAESAAKDSDWWKADYLSADADASPDTRRILRMRSRYECQNNSYARGIIQYLANDIVGNGPSLRYASADDRLNSRIERDFTAWAETVRLGDKLRAVRIARARDGRQQFLLHDFRQPVRIARARDGRQRRAVALRSIRRFNSRPSCDGRLADRLEAALKREFQFTPVVRRATSPLPCRARLPCFNSRPSCDGRLRPADEVERMMVSIHARRATGDWIN